MGTSLRLLRAFALLAGFHLLALAVPGALLGAGLAAWAWTPAAVAVTVTVLSVLLGVPVVRGTLALGGTGRADVAGLPVTDAEQPELWRTVRSLAEHVGTRAPDVILLTGDANAGVREDARLLGLLPGPRRLYVGVPLLTGLTEPQLHAVLAHELAHYGNADTRLAGITHRGRDSVLRTVEAFREQERKRVDKERSRQEKAAAKAIAEGREAEEVSTGRAGLTHRLTAKPFLAYARVCLRATHGADRAQELAADRTAARIAGRDATASALRETAALDAAHDFYMSRYATMGVPAGLLPPHGEVFGGLRRLLAAPGRQEDLAELRGEPPAGETSPYDTHPSPADRIRLIEALPDDGRAAAPARPALALLRDADRVLRELESAVLTPEAQALERADWPELTHRTMHALALEEARPLRAALAAAPRAGTPGATADLTAFLDAVDAGLLWQIADRLPKSPEAARATGRAAREFLRPRLHSGLYSLTELALAETAGARWTLSWSEPARLLLPTGAGTDEAVAAAVRPAVGDVPDTAPLRELLRTSTV
ncbi:M48 family metalloprotease [Streptomyces sp. AV19]|uniref:M48 family metalloprotease n=1 Tax=Streptomyces sp. AV19 TaxID=2793068 RepID=UPI0018FE35D3|nr:M48 family metallopeptidase [Streptomyces sp. AV19]MBH1935512.1 M48 family metalloprotease [Streptomyces sp. AV19]MDG4534400.1 M48 family metalloprotease [Streptomyces sp. AV19]